MVSPPNRDGQFAISHLVPGRYTISARTTISFGNPVRAAHSCRRRCSRNRRSTSPTLTFTGSNCDSAGAPAATNHGTPRRRFVECRLRPRRFVRCSSLSDRQRREPARPRASSTRSRRTAPRRSGSTRGLNFGASVQDATASICGAFPGPWPVVASLGDRRRTRPARRARSRLVSARRSRTSHSR